MAKDFDVVHIDCLWDDEACVWVATSPDAQGLVLEDDLLTGLFIV